METKVTQCGSCSSYKYCGEFRLKKRKNSNDILEIHFVSIQRPRDICMQ